MSPLTIGIDVSKAKLDVAILMDTNTYQVRTFDNQNSGFRSLHKWLKKLRAKACHVCLESTSRYGDAIAQFLFDRHFLVSVVNPAQVHAYGKSQLKRNKTDREDAKVIAHFCWAQKPRPWQPPSPALQELQSLTRYLDTLKDDRTRLKNRSQSGITSKLVLLDLKQQIVALNKRIKLIEQHIKQHVNDHPDLKRRRDLLKTIPGIGSLTANLLTAELPDIDQFTHINQLVAYVGLSPRLSQSGSSLNRRGGIVKTGSSRLRKSLYFPAVTAIRCNPIIMAFAQRLKSRGKTGKSLIVAAMRKLLHLIYGILKHGQPFDPHYLQKQVIPT